MGRQVGDIKVHVGPRPGAGVNKNFHFSPGGGADVGGIRILINALSELPRSLFETNSSQPQIGILDTT